MLCDGCGRREATSIMEGTKTAGETWRLHLCDTCDPQGLDRELTEEDYEELSAGVSPEQLAELRRRFGLA